MNSTFRILLLLVLSSVAFAQKYEFDTAAFQLRPKNIRAGVDVIPFITGNAKIINAELTLRNYILSIDIGTASKEDNNENSDYSNNGSFYKAQILINLLQKERDKNVMFLGWGFAKSEYTETLSYSSANQVFRNGNAILVKNDISARWFEIDGGLRLKMGKFIWLGYNLQFKYSPKVLEEGEFLPHHIPGYGFAEKNLTWGMNYFIQIGLDF